MDPQNPLSFQGAGQAPLSTAPPPPAPAQGVSPQPAPQASPSQGSIDPDVQTFTKAIAMQEGGGSLLPYDAKGKSGETGRYQFIPDTWKNYAQQTLGDPNAPMTSANQNQVAYATFEKWHNAGYSWAQMASMWNAGEGAPDAYKTGNKGVNGEGVGYDTPTYVKNVQKYAQQLAGQNGINGQMPGLGALTPQPSPNSIEGASEAMSSLPPTTDAPAQPETTLQKAGDVAKGVGNFLFPIAGDVYNDVTGKNQKTALQQTADAGLSALPFIPGLGELGETARGGETAVEGGADVAKSGLLQKLLGSTTAKGAATGYGAGVLSNLSQGQGVGQALTPNASNLLGAATGGVLGAVAPRLSKLIAGSATGQGALDSATKNLTEEIARTAPGRQLLSNLPENGQRAMRLIVQSGALPAVEGNSYGVADGIDNIEARLSQLGQARAQAIDKFAPETDLDALANSAKSKITSAPEGATDAEKHIALQRTMSGESQKMAQKIDSIVADIKATTGKNALTAPELEAFKEAQTANSGVFRRTGAIGDQNAASLLGGEAKDKMENLAKDAGFPGMKEYNQHMSDHYHAIQLLQRLGRQTVKGGRLGNMLMSHTAGMAGTVAANSLGGGFLGSIAGLLAGESGGNFLSKLMSGNSLSNPLKDAVLEKMEQEDPSIVEELKQFAGKSGNIAPLKKAGTKSPLSGILPGLMVKAGARAGAGAGSAIGS